MFCVIRNNFFIWAFLVNKNRQVNRKTSEIKNAMQQQSRPPVHDEDEPDISSEGIESYLEGKLCFPTQMFVLCDKLNKHLCRRCLR